MKLAVLRAFRREIEKRAGVLDGVARQWHGVVGGPALRAGERSMLDVLGDFGRAPVRTFREGWADTPRPWQAVGALGAGYDIGQSIATPEERRKNLGAALGGALGGVVMSSRVPLAGSILGYQVMRSLGGGVGGLFDEPAA